jgi:hypothetical protein
VLPTFRNPLSVPSSRAEWSVGSEKVVYIPVMRFHLGWRAN